MIKEASFFSLGYLIGMKVNEFQEEKTSSHL